MAKSIVYYLGIGKYITECTIEITYSMPLGHFTKTNISAVNTHTHTRCLFTWYCILSFCLHIITFVYIDTFLFFSFCLHGFNLPLCTGRQGKETLTLLECELFRRRRSLGFLLLVSVNERNSSLLCLKI